MPKPVVAGLVCLVIITCGWTLTRGQVPDPADKPRNIPIAQEINIEQADLPTAIPLEACYLGWQQSLSQLAQLVEPEIPK